MARLIPFLLALSLLAACAPSALIPGPLTVPVSPQDAIIRLADLGPRHAPSGVYGAFPNFQVVSIQSSAVTLQSTREGESIIVTCTASAVEGGAAVDCAPNDRAQRLLRALAEAYGVPVQ